MQCISYFSKTKIKIKKGVALKQNLPLTNCGTEQWNLEQVHFIILHTHTYTNLYVLILILNAVPTRRVWKIAVWKLIFVAGGSALDKSRALLPLADDENLFARAMYGCKVEKASLIHLCKACSEAKIEARVEYTSAT